MKIEEGNLCALGLKKGDVVVCIGKPFDNSPWTVGKKYTCPDDGALNADSDPPQRSSITTFRIVSRASEANDGWSQWTSASEWDTGKHDVQFECIDGIHRVRTRPRKPAPPREFWINKYNEKLTTSQPDYFDLKDFIHVREVTP